MKKKIDICVIGSGMIFQLYHLDAIIGSSFFNIKYIVDKNKRIADKNAKILNAIPLYDSNSKIGTHTSSVTPGYTVDS